MSEGGESGVEGKIPRHSPLFLFFDYLKIVSVRGAAFEFRIWTFVYTRFTLPFLASAFF